ncbi:MAG: 50S ribosomal protein L22 [Thermodesulfovibrio sp.]|nr:50S ribosomal protein L22 [Thermodesulfovibrio sp.]MCX7725088.1 50S ribosomal protein L22 [Thermodesulfovibrio sp.]MDW7972685.1 50S ribosomal protein L22 [Thermodesulfovibrio sp.]
MEARAILRYARITPTKVRRIVNLIRGKKAADALLMLKYMPHRGARIVEKLLRSALANAEQKNPRIDIDNLKITKAYVDQGPMMKRIEYRAMGRANIRKKKTSHITIYVGIE